MAKRAVRDFWLSCKSCSSLLIHTASQAHAQVDEIYSASTVDNVNCFLLLKKHSMTFDLKNTQMFSSYIHTASQLLFVS